MNFPKLLQPGDTILLIAPSSPLRSTTAEACAEGLEKMGYKVKLGASVHSKTEKGYAAAPAKLRAADINTGFADEDINAIWAVRGGSMATEVLPYLDYETIAAHPKPLFGFSDVTALHTVLQKKCGMVSFHAPCASSFSGEGPHKYALASFLRAMAMEDSLEFENVDEWPIDVIHDGHAEGILAGGNMTLVAAMVGTEYAIDAKGKILFLEDVDEDVYRLNRMLIQLKQSGMLDDAEGLLFGDFTDCKNPYNESYDPSDLLREFFADYDKPVYSHLSVGHIAQNGTIPLGAKCVMEGGKIRFSR